MRKAIKKLRNLNAVLKVAIAMRKSAAARLKCRYGSTGLSWWKWKLEATKSSNGVLGWRGKATGWRLRSSRSLQMAKLKPCILSGPRCPLQPSNRLIAQHSERSNPPPCSILLHHHQHRRSPRHDDGPVLGVFAFD